MSRTIRAWRLGLLVGPMLAGCYMATAVGDGEPDADPGGGGSDSGHARLDADEDRRGDAGSDDDDGGGADVASWLEDADALDDGCRPFPEACNGSDDDCDGLIDEGLARRCTTVCGAGTEVCSRGRWSGCTAPVPAPESCDGLDNDCDGVTDEGCAGPTSAVVESSPGPSCSGEHNRTASISAVGCPTVTISGAFVDRSDGSTGQVVEALHDASSFDLTWDDAPLGSDLDCDLDISGSTSWTVARAGDALSITVTHAITGYEAGNTVLCGYTISGRETVLLGRPGETHTQTYSYGCSP